MPKNWFPSDLAIPLRNTLLDCGPFDDKRQLKAVFAHPSLSPWRHRLPGADNVQDQVDYTIDFLLDLYTSDGTNVLILFLQILSRRIEPEDACHHRLAELAESLDQVYRGKTSPPTKQDAKATISKELVSPKPNLLPLEEQKPKTQPLVFISYSQRDEKEKDQLLEHLGILQQAGLINLWSDDRIEPGADWQAEINRAIAQARVVILLISANFLNSDFSLNKIAPALQQRQHRDDLVIFPVIAKACAWQAIGWLARMDVRPKHKKPVWRESGRQVDGELAAIAEEVARIIGLVL